MVRPETIEVRAESPATLVITYGDPASLLAPGWDGLITGLYVAPNEVIRTGDVVLSVNSIDRIAWHSKAPFYRTMTLKSTGDDVQELRTMLARLGYLDTAQEAGLTYDKTVQEAVAQFAASIGTKSSSFDPSWVVWLPEDNYVIGNVIATVGAQAAVGAVLATAKPEVLSAVLSGTDGRQLSYDFSAPTQMTASNFPDPIGVSSPNLTAAEIAELSTWPLGPDSGEDGTTAPLVATLDVTLEATEPVWATQIAVSSIYTDSAGQHCVFTKEVGSGDDDLSSILVTPLEATPSPGLTYLSPPIETGIEIVAKPAVWVSGRLCT